LETVGDCLGQPLADWEIPPPNSPPRSLLDDPRISRAERARIANRFLGSLAVRMSRIRQALWEEDRDLLIGEVHALAGTAGLLGFSKLSEHARELERQTRNHATFPALRTAATPLLEAARSAGQEDAAE
jgi:HPt (histidine-containing phosphotransfer) domain-containing protein